MFARRKERQCTCNLILRRVRDITVVFAVLGSALNVALLHGYGKTPQLVGNAANLVVCGNISLTINIALSGNVTEYSTVIRTQ
jgi:hypothetical protein